MTDQASAGDQAGHPEPSLIPANEPDRLRAVRRYDILDTPPDGAFDRIAALAARIFEVPVATVTIVDEDRIWFKATHGVEITEIGRDPGLCASAILVDAPTAIEDATVDPAAWNNPLVRGEFGLRYYAAAPITTSDGYHLGTVNIIDRVPRQTSQEQLATLQDLAAIVIDELELRLSAIREVRLERRRREEVQRSKAQVEEVARTLQQTLLPPRMPHVPGIEFSAFYHPAPLQEVGGDFYDVFPLGGRRWAVSIGDVSGKGVRAAALTSLARYALRGAAIQTTDPSVVLAALNETIAADQRGQDVPRYCTAVFGVIEQTGSGSATVRLANGGHPPAVICRADGSIERLTASGPMLGWLPESRYPTVETILAPGDGLLFYTDGITDARRYGQRFGEGRLAAALADRPHNNAKSLVRWVRNLMNEFDPPGYDDVAVISISVEPQPASKPHLTGVPS
jgi:sigma-B regulation protein RsbU (phosphoserine phosphatase)